MVLRNFERKLEQLVEGAFVRAFRSSVRPIELGRRLAREIDDHRTLGVSGQVVAPNHFLIRLNESDHEEFSEVHDTLVRQLEEAAREHARDEGYTFMGPVEVVLEVDPALRTGSFTIESRLREGPGGSAGSLVLPTGERVRLGDDPVSIGRLPDCTIVLADPNVSRRHAEVRRHGDGYVVVDLGSTNGTRVNGAGVRERALLDGDEVGVGSTTIRFEAS